MKLLELTRAKRNMSVAMDGFVKAAQQGSRQTFTQRFPNATPAQLAMADELWGDIYKDVSFDEMLDKIAGVYQRHLTKQDVVAMTAFYTSAVGQKLLDQMPAIMQESMQVGTDYMRDKMKPALARMDEHMKNLMESVSEQQPPDASPAPKRVSKKQPPKK